ncbi:Hcp family type VI secretion system effector [Roseibium algae]|uniref:Type VI secretion system tube protein Hcp n=1 Tax=Roseibium algae TaxID=3123038 RepID=A0ABU8TFF4_9HYPH
MADDAFMYIEDSVAKINGESTDKTFESKKAFELKSVSFGIENSSSIGSSTSGAGQGKTTFNPISITKQVDSASTSLVHSCTLGNHLNKAFIELRRAGAVSGNTGGGTFMKFHFKQVLVTKVEWSGSGGEENVEETVEFVYGAIKIEYWTQGTDGKLKKPTGGGAEAEYNLTKNSASF